MRDYLFEKENRAPNLDNHDTSDFRLSKWRRYKQKISRSNYPYLQITLTEFFSSVKQSRNLYHVLKF